MFTHCINHFNTLPVILNGCSTKGQVAALLEQGIPVVVATSAPVNDFRATQFSITFFEELALNAASIKEAFDAAISAAKVKGNIKEEIGDRGIVLRPTSASREATWGLYYQEGKEAITTTWRLPEKKDHLGNLLTSSKKKGPTIINNKNTVVGTTISAGGNVQIGDNTTITESKTSRNLRLLLFGLVPILVIGATYFWYQYQVMQQPLQVKVLIENTTPNQELPAPKGKLILTYEGKKETKNDVSQSMLFEGIPAHLRKKTLQVQYQAKGFVTIDTTFPYQTAIVLRVKRNADLAQIKGKVADEAGSPLAGVKVAIDCCPAVQTDEAGGFLLNIPFKHQRQQQRITLFKTGYKEKSVTDPIIAGELYQYFLQKL